MNLAKNNTLKAIIILMVLFAPFFVVLADAEITPIPNTENLQVHNPIEAKSIPDLIKILLEGVIKIGIPIVVLAIIYSGFLFVFAGGNSEKVTKARDALVYSVIGAAILLGSWGIAELIKTTVVELAK